MCLIVNSDGYKILTTAVKGREEEHKKIKYLIEEIKQQSRNKGKTKDPNRKFKKYRYELKKLEREKDIDEKEKKRLEDSLHNYLTIATTACSTALSTCMNHQNSIRQVLLFISIWFRNSGSKKNDIRDLLENAFSRIPR